MSNVVERVDLAVASFLSDWSILTTLLTLSLVALVAYPILYPDEPDTHPLLLARQSSASLVRNKYESACYRSPEVPPDSPLRSGLNVKEAGAPRWAVGKDGDLRDVWREVQRGGSVGEDGKEMSAGLIMSLHGTEEVIEHSIEEMSREIAIMGLHFRSRGVKMVALYLPNGVEYLESIFACSFYGVTPILLPFNLPPPKVYELLRTVQADSLICAAGSLPLDDIAAQCQNLRLITWVVEHTSRHMDWNGAPPSAAAHLTVSVWHDIIDEQKSTAASPNLPSTAQGEIPSDLITIWQSTSSSSSPPAEIITFTQRNLVAATAAALSALPLRQRVTPADLVLLADSLSYTYVLVNALAALYAHASLALTSVASAGIDLSTATRGIAPTVIIASAETLAILHTKEMAGVTTAAQRVGRYTHAQANSAGRMPTDNLLFKMLAPASTAAGNTPGKLRLILTSERAGLNSPPLTSTMLSDLRLLTRARICYALTASHVAGAVAQTHVFDYRRVDGQGAAQFGVPLSCVEVLLVDKEDDGQVSGSEPKGEIVVKGPAVSGEKARLGVRGKVSGDGTLGYV